MPTYVLLRGLNRSSQVRVPVAGSLAAPANFSATPNAAGAGSLAAGTYYYKVTAIGDSGETIGSTEDSAVVDAANNEQQLVTVSSSDGGTFTLTYAGQTTAAIAWDAAAATVQSALIALSNIGPSDVSVSGGTGPWTVTFQGALANTNVAVMTADGTNLTGSGHAVAVTTPVGGDDGDVVDLEWDAVDGAVSYRVYRGTVTNTQTLYLETEDTELTDDGSDAGEAGTVPTSNTASYRNSWARLSPTEDTLVDLDDVETRKSLNHHLSIGQYVVVAANNKLADGTTLTVNS